MIAAVIANAASIAMRIAFGLFGFISDTHSTLPVDNAAD